ncbi:ATP-dependent DNA ligase [Chitiniphilus purpureus]|uniref:DNA ligase (ATP) n=1 Tax=Chitiniphilus purpureus TaxID=2981137 RepID=A0ABY6DRP4_9NEIS|nr:ATP-dependent DNA ligase [Chitiniphilus sp. CD1]UXY17045.1 ATP-dependent DNA ligase [Chitiniphilus sp. CD1]
MKRFAQLYAALDATTSSNAKLAALQTYFASAPPEDAAWAVYFLAGGKPRQLVPAKLLRQLAREAAGLPEWLFDECYHAVGDLAETIALVVPAGDGADEEGAGLAGWLEQRLLPLRGMAPDALATRLSQLWRQLDRQGVFVATKLITGSLRVGVSRLLVTRALAAVAGVDAKLVAQRLVAYTHLAARPGAEQFQALIAPPDATTRRGGAPYPFFLAHPLQGDPAAQLGPLAAWQAEWKWDGIRAQLVKRDGTCWLWSRGEELVTERFPELAALAEGLPDGTVLDGEIVIWRDGQVQPFALLQQRIGRKTLGAALLREAPAALLAYDLLEWQGEDWRARPLQTRRAQLEAVLAARAAPALRCSPLLQAADWPALAALRGQSRSLGVEGVMLKALASAYGAGRTKDVGVWWKWKIDPYSVDAVLIYAQAGHGRRASLYTDYTFAVWDGDGPQRQLVPFAKAYSGLTDEEIRDVDQYIRRHTVEKFGPVRSVTPALVFELGFEGIARSTRHKSGVAVRFPRILRWRHDKPIAEADTLATLQALLPAGS